MGWLGCKEDACKGGFGLHWVLESVKKLEAGSFFFSFVLSAAHLYL